MTEPEAPSKMTYDEAVARIPERKLPDFWVASPERVLDELKKVMKGKVTEIARSPGNRPIHAVTYGEPDGLPKANYNSAVGAAEPDRYFDKAARSKPVVMLLGPVHGHEVEGITGLANFLSVIETGKDLAGKARPELSKRADLCRLVIIPVGNPDGNARFEPRALQGMERVDIEFWAQGTWKDDSLCHWRGGKRLHPKIGDEVGYLGCYYDDAGVNPMHDEFFAPMSTTAPAVLKLAQQWGPDLFASLHSCGYPPGLCHPAFTPVEVQQVVLDISEEYYKRVIRQGIPCQKCDWKPGPFSREHFNNLNLTSAVHHTCGADVFSFESPHGIRDNCLLTCEQILEIQLTLYAVMMDFVLEKKVTT